MNAYSGYSILHFLLKYGLSLLLVLFLIFVGASAFINFPEQKTVPIMLEISPKPVKLTTSASGYITISKKEGEFVKAGDTIAIVSNNTQIRSALLLENWIDSLIQNISSILVSETIATIPAKHIPAFNSDYIALQGLLEESQIQIQNSEYQISISSLMEKKKHEKEQLKNLNEQINYQKKEIEIVRTELERDCLFFRLKTISPLELETSYLKFLNTRKNYQRLRADSLLREFNMIDYQLEVKALKVKKNHELEQIRARILSHLRIFRSNIRKWKSDHLILSPDDGIISHAEVWNDKLVLENEHVFNLLGKRNVSVFGVFEISTNETVDIKIGQKVNIALNSFPPEDWGYLRGQVQELSLVPKHGMTSVKVEIEKFPKTSRGRPIDFRIGLSGTCDIVVSERSLFEVIFLQR